MEIEPSSFWFRHRNQVIEAVVRYFPPSGIIFDIGGGNGHVAIALQAAGFPMALIEPGPDGARNAYSRGIRTVIQSSLADAGFPLATLPAIGCFDVIEHIADDRDSGHQRRYTLIGLRTLLTETGFEINFATYFFAWLPLPMLIARSLPYRLGMSRSQGEHRAKREHKPLSGPVGQIFGGVLALEERWIQRGRSIPFGASCLVVASTRD